MRESLLAYEEQLKQQALEDHRFQVLRWEIQRGALTEAPPFPELPPILQ